MNEDFTKDLSIAHVLEDRIMDCWGVTSDIKLAYEEYLDSPDNMDEDELSNILIGIEYLYNRKFKRLWKAFEDVCEHGGVWLDSETILNHYQIPSEEEKQQNLKDYHERLKQWDV